MRVDGASTELINGSPNLEGFTAVNDDFPVRATSVVPGDEVGSITVENAGLEDAAVHY